MTLNVADALVETAVRAGVERVYGVIGDSLNPIGDAIRRDGRLRWIHLRHEEAGAFAAGAEAQLTGKATMCAGSAGPGVRSKETSYSPDPRSASSPQSACASEES